MERFIAGLSATGRRNVVLGGIMVPVMLFTGIVASKWQSTRKSEDTVVEILARERLGQKIGVQLSKADRRQLERERLDILLRLERIFEGRVAQDGHTGPMLEPREGRER